jgi:hypothetical protein
LTTAKTAASSSLAVAEASASGLLTPSWPEAGEGARNPRVPSDKAEYAAALMALARLANVGAAKEGRLASVTVADDMRDSDMDLEFAAKAYNGACPDACPLDETGASALMLLLPDATVGSSGDVRSPSPDASSAAAELGDDLWGSNPFAKESSA